MGKSGRVDLFFSTYVEGAFSEVCEIRYPFSFPCLHIFCIGPCREAERGVVRLYNEERRGEEERRESSRVRSSRAIQFSVTQYA